VADGKQLYVDVSETNPPLIVWLNLPAVWLSQLSGLPLQWCWVGLVCLLYLYAIVVIAKLPKPCPWLKIAIVLAIGPGFGLQFSQREHLFFLLCLPYCLSLLPGNQPRSVPAALAAIGAMIKPFYLVVPAVFMLHRALREGRWLTGCFIRQNLVFAAVCLAYTLWLLLGDTTYLQHVVPQLSAHYTAYNLPATALIMQFVLIPLTCLIPWFFWLIAAQRSGQGVAGSLIWVLLFAGVWLAAVLQMKAWSNHMQPLLVVAMIISMVVLLSARHHQDRLSGKVALVWAVVFLLVGAGKSLSDLTAIAQREIPAGSAALLQQPDVAQARTVYGMGFNFAADFPVMLKLHQRYSAPYAHLWFLPGLLHGRVDAPDAAAQPLTPEQMSAPEKQYFDAMVDAFVTAPPDLVAIDNQPDYYHPLHGSFRFDYPDYYRQDPRFAAAFARYARVFSGAKADYYAPSHKEE
jgi:hypothetical protein